MAERCLLDTQIIIWAMKDPGRLTETQRSMVASPENVTVSAVSFWEVEIKRQLGKLDVPRDMLDQVSRAGIPILPITATHAIEAGRLPLHHRDPFDRMLIAQARIEGLSILSADRNFRLYDVHLA